MAGTIPRPGISWVAWATWVGWLETCLDPLRGVVKEVLLSVRVLAWRGFTGRARRGAVRRALDNDELLVRTGSVLEVDFAIPNEVMSAHGGDQHRDRDALDRASRGIVARAPIQVVHRVLGADGVGAG